MSKTSMNILVTGGAGYIGSHTCVELLNAGEQVIVLDNFSNAKPEALNRVINITGQQMITIEGDIRDAALLETIFSQHNIDAVLHFAGLKAVGESTMDPLNYYDNNVNGSLCLLRAMQKHGVKTLIFSSSATVYGDPDSVPIFESSPLRATNPYGQTKLVIELMCQHWVESNSEVSVTLLRYFNPVGAHDSGTLGEDPQGVPSNLMPFIAQVAVGKRKSLSIFGDDYDTPDGTGVRDYIHVVDLAQGHVAALKQRNEQAGCHVFNLGTGQGVSVLEMVTEFSKVTGQDIPYQIAARRPGDIAQCYASSQRARLELDWSSKRELQQMIADTWHWQRLNPDGYV